MKFLAPLFLLLLSTGLLHAQSVILLEQDSVAQVLEDVDISNEYKEFPLSLFFKNNTDSSISIHWRREFGGNCPLEWDVTAGDQNITYIPTVNESYHPIGMEPGDSNFIVQQIFYPRSVPGCCDIRLIFSLEGDADNPVDTGYFHIEVNAEGCLATSVSEEDAEAFNVYPNPASGFLNIVNGHLIESIEMLDLSGKIHDQRVGPAPPQIDISSLPAGVYFCRIRNRPGKLWIKKILLGG